MREVHVGIVGLGNVGSGTLAILADNADQIALKLGFRLKVAAVCSRSVASKQSPRRWGRCSRPRTGAKWSTHPDVDIVAELVGGTGVAAEIVEAAIANRKSVVTANKELMAACGPEIWDRAIRAGINLAMEASVCGRHPHPRRAARRHLRRPRHGALRHPQRHLQLHPHRDGKARRAARDGAGGGAARWATPKPIPAPISTASTRAPSWRSWRPWRSARRSRPPIFSWKASAASRRWISATRTSLNTPSG